MSAAMRTRSVFTLVGVLAAIAACGCGSNGQGAKTVTVERQVTVENPTTPRKHQRKSAPKPTATTPASDFVSCDPNIQAKVGTTTCPFAENVFWTYWTSGESTSLQVWSPAAATTFSTTCESGEQVVCTTSDGGAVKFAQAALDRYSQTQADAYASRHDLGPSYEPPPPQDSYPTQGENIPNYENGRGSRVQCADGMYSQSGGIQGACSGHGGVAE